MAERKLAALRRKDEVERAMEQTRRNMGEQVAALEKEIDGLAEKNAKLICKTLISQYLSMIIMLKLDTLRLSLLAISSSWLS